jgi:hypothetical protein
MSLFGTQAEHSGRIYNETAKKLGDARIDWMTPIGLYGLFEHFYGFDERRK